MKLLVLEDDSRAAGCLTKGLTEQGFAVDLCYDGQEGFNQALIGGYDLMVLDVMPATIDGWSVLQTMREKKCHTPVIMLTALDGVQDRVNGLASGADDYLTIPYAFAELVARIRAALAFGRLTCSGLTISCLI